MKKLVNPTDSSIDTISENQTKVVIAPQGSLVVYDNVAEEVKKRYDFLLVEDTNELPPPPEELKPEEPKAEEAVKPKKEPKKKSNSLKPRKYESKKKRK